jgi:hypothetical protein
MKKKGEGEEDGGMNGWMRKDLVGGGRMLLRTGRKRNSWERAKREG